MKAMVSKDEVRARLQVYVSEHGGVQVVAKRWKCSRQYIYDVLNDRRNPGPLMLKKFGLRRVRIVHTHYEKV